MGDLIYVVVDGELEVVRESADGAEQLLKIATPGEYVGEIGPLFHMARSATVRARTDAIVTGYTVQAVHRLLDAYAERSLIDHRDLGGAALLTGTADAPSRDFDADTGRVDPVDIATAPGTTAGSLRLSAKGRRLIVATHGPSGERSVHDEARGTVDSPDVKPIYFEKVAQGSINSDNSE